MKTKLNTETVFTSSGFTESFTNPYFNLSIDKFPGIKKVIFNDPATIIYWNDGSKTVVKAQGEDFDAEKGLAMAIAKKALGNTGRYYKVIDNALKEYHKEERINKHLREALDDSFKRLNSDEILAALSKIFKGEN